MVLFRRVILLSWGIGAYLESISISTSWPPSRLVSRFLIRPTFRPEIRTSAALVSIGDSSNWALKRNLVGWRWIGPPNDSHSQMRRQKQDSAKMTIAAIRGAFGV